MEVVNIYSQNSVSFVPINMCYLSALGFGFTQQNRHESHCSQQSAVSYYLQHKVDCYYCECEFHPLQPWDTLLNCIDSFPERGINTVISISIPSHALHFGTQHLIDENVGSMELAETVMLKHHIHWPGKEVTGEHYKSETSNCATYRLMATTQQKMCNICIVINTWSEFQSSNPNSLFSLHEYFNYIKLPIIPHIFNIYDVRGC